MLGTLKTETARTRSDLLAPSVAAALDAWPADAPVDADQVLVAPIDAALSDTAAFCEAYEVSPEETVNCVIVAGKREGEVRYAACVVLATTRADVNSVVRRHLGVRKCSFAPMDDAVSATGMEYGGITPIGLPDGWRVLLDARIATDGEPALVGSGLRRSKLLLPGALLARLPGIELVDGLGLPVE